MSRVGIVGGGFVGGAIAKGFAKVSDVRIYDIDPDISTHSLEETINNEFVFVCLPTPMGKESGHADTSILEGFFEECKDIDTEAIFIIKSTVPVGTTDMLIEKYPKMEIVHNPEFLTAAEACDDFMNPDRIVIGGDEEITSLVAELYRELFKFVPILQCSTKESEMIKYTINCFLATKLTYFNEIKLLTDKYGIDYENVMVGAVSDRRVGKSHCDVPGNDGKPGFGGMCFPKDINAFICTMKDNGIEPLVLDAVWQQNKRIRKDA